MNAGLSWTANIIALAVLVVFLAIAKYDAYSAPIAIVIGVVLAVAVWAIERGLRYVLAGS